MKNYSAIHALAGLAVLSVMSGGGSIPMKPRNCRYSTFCGPPHPTTRQQLRAMMREAAKPLKGHKA